RIMSLRRLGYYPVFGLRRPLVRARGALGQVVFVAVQVLEEVVIPFCRVGGPGPLQTAGNGVGALAGPVAVLPAELLVLHPGALRFRADGRRRGSAMGLAEGVAAGNERHR